MTTIHETSELDEFSTPIGTGMSRLAAGDQERARARTREEQRAIQPRLEEADRARWRAEVEARFVALGCRRPFA